jgi:acetyltransferase
MLERQDYELILGSKKDADFGPVILFGMGGILTEVLKDQSIALPPLNRLLALRLMESTRVYRLLQGYRNRPAANLELLEEILIRLSQLVVDFPEITELDINPLLMVEGGACAVDARVCIASSEVASPMHLVISPYPSQYEATVEIQAGVKIFARPIKPEDAPLLVELYNSLSPTSIYFRFFRPVKSLSSEMLARFTQIDYDRDVAFVGLLQKEEGQMILGVARLMADPDVTQAEFAVVIRDDWQGRGVGAMLLEKCISVARERGMRLIWGHVLPENINMLALGRKLGFSVKRVSGSSSYELRIDLTRA